MLLDARTKEEMKQRAKELYEFIDRLEVVIEESELKKADEAADAIAQSEVGQCCRTCEHWDAGCKLADFSAPPEEVQAKGCDLWLEVDEIPF